MADVDDEESSGDEESSQDEEEPEEGGVDEGMNGQEVLEEGFDDNADLEGTLPEEWEPFIDMPQIPQLPSPSFQPENFNLFPDNWLDEEEATYSLGTPILIMCLAIFLLWYAYMGDRSNK